MKVQLVDNEALFPGNNNNVFISYQTLIIRMSHVVDSYNVVQKPFS